MKACLAAVTMITAAAVATWGIVGTSAEGGPSIYTVARNAGIVVGGIMALMTLNYLYAWSLIRRLRKGAGAIARWTVAPADYAAFRKAERATRRRRNNWGAPKRFEKTGLPVVFGTGAVVVGDTFFLLRSKGMSRFTFVRIEAGTVDSVEFAMTLKVIATGAHPLPARHKGHLRVPIAKDAQVKAMKVVQHYASVIAG